MLDNQNDNETEQNSDDFSMSDIASGVGGMGKKAARSLLGLNSKKKDGKVKKAAKTAAKEAAKALLKALRVLISLIPLPVKIGILLVLVCLLIFAFKKGQSILASDNTTDTVKTVMDVYASEKNTSDDVTIKGEKTNSLQYAKDDNEAKRRKSLAKFFKENSSFVNMKLSDIKTIYDVYCLEYEIKKKKGENTTLDDKLYTSYTTVVGEDSKWDEEDGSLIEEVKSVITKDKDGKYVDNLNLRNERIANVKEKDYFFEKMLLTEKYNMNQVKWNDYSHVTNGGSLTFLKQDKEYGLQYPKSLKQDQPSAWDPNNYLNRVVKIEDVDETDGKDRETFTKLLTPYLQSWLIPLSYYSGLVSEGVEAEAATKFAYSVIKNTYSNVIANRYQLEDYILNTRFDEYYIYHYATNFNIQVRTYKENKTKSSTVKKTTTSTTKAGVYVVRSDSAKTPLGYLKNDKGNRIQYTEDEAEAKCLELNGDANTPKSTLNGYNYYYEAIDVPDSENTTSDILQYIVYYAGKTVDITKEEPKIENVTVNKTTNVEKYSFFNSNGNALAVSTTPVLVKTEYYNQRLEPTTVTVPDDGILTEGMLGKVDYKKESLLQQIDQNKETGRYVSVRYYVSQARTFDAKIATQYNYIKYSVNDVESRINEASKSELKTEKFEEKDHTNEITQDQVKNTLSDDKSLNDIANDLDSTILSVESAYSYGSSDEAVKKLDDNRGTKLKDLMITKDGETDDKSSKYIVIKFKSNKNYTEKIGSPDGEVQLATGRVLNNVVSPTGEKMGIHYIQRKWNDKLNIYATKTDPYTVEDLKNWNNDYEKKNSIVDGFNFNTRLAISYESTKYYEDLENQKILNRVDFMNANRSIFKDYLYDRAPYSDTIGYYRSILQTGMDELKKQFSDILERNNTYPFKYGETLGFRDLVENNLGGSTSVSAGFIWPVDNKYVSAIQGYSTVYGESHSGVDIWSDTDGNTHQWSWVDRFPVYAIASGTVIVASDSQIPNTQVIDNSGLGNYIVIRHESGYISSYGHLSSGTFKVKEGDVVTQGQIIGYVGSSGSSSCMHLHFNIYDNSDGTDRRSAENKLDPLDFYVVEINPNVDNSGNIPEYAALKADESLRSKITMFNAYMITGSKGGGTGALHSTVFADAKSFVAATKEGLSKRSNIDPDSDLLKDDCLELVYNKCVAANRSPELCIVIAISENHKLNGYGQHNYWNVGVYNDDNPNDSSKGYSQFEQALDTWISNSSWIDDPNDDRYQRAVQRIDNWGSKSSSEGPPKNFAPGVYDSIAFYKCVYSTPDKGGEGEFYHPKLEDTLGPEQYWVGFARYLDDAVDILLNIWKGVYGG